MELVCGKCGGSSFTMGKYQEIGREETTLTCNECKMEYRVH